MRNLIVLAGVIVLLSLGIFGLMSMNNSFSLTDAFTGEQTGDCSWQDVTVDGQTYDTIDSFKTDWNSANDDISFAELSQRVDFRVNDGALEYESCQKVVSE